MTVSPSWPTAPALSERDRRAIRFLLDLDEPTDAIADDFGVSRETVAAVSEDRS